MFANLKIDREGLERRFNPIATCIKKWRKQPSSCGGEVIAMPEKLVQSSPGGSNVKDGSGSPSGSEFEPENDVEVVGPSENEGLLEDEDASEYQHDPPSRKRKCRIDISTRVAKKGAKSSDVAIMVAEMATSSASGSATPGLNCTSPVQTVCATTSLVTQSHIGSCTNDPCLSPQTLQQQQHPHGPCLPPPTLPARSENPFTTQFAFPQGFASPCFGAGVVIAGNAYRHQLDGHGVLNDPSPFLGQNQWCRNIGADPNLQGYPGSHLPLNNRFGPSYLDTDDLRAAPSMPLPPQVGLWSQLFIQPPAGYNHPSYYHAQPNLHLQSGVHESPYPQVSAFPNIDRCLAAPNYPGVYIAAAPTRQSSQIMPDQILGGICGR